MAHAPTLLHTDFLSSHQISLVPGLSSVHAQVFSFPPLHPRYFLQTSFTWVLYYCLAGLPSPSPRPCPISPLLQSPATQSRPQAPGDRVLTGMGPDMSFQIKGVVEAFSTEGAQVSLHLAVTLDVTVEHPLQAKAFATQLAAMHRSVVTGAGGELRNGRGLGE